MQHMKNKNYNTDANQRHFQGSSRFSHTTPPHFLRFSRSRFGFQGFPRFLKVFQGNGHPVKCHKVYPFLYLFSIHGHFDTHFFCFLTDIE